MYSSDQRIIDLKQLFLYIWDNFIIIVLTGLVFSGLFCSYKFYESKKPIDSDKVYNEILTKNKEAINPPAGVYNYTSEREVIEGSCVVKSQIYIYYNFDNYKNAEGIDYNSLMTRFQNDISNVMFSSNVLVSIADQMNKKYSSVNTINADDLRYMINWTFGATNTAAFSVTDINKDRAIDISKLLGDNITSRGVDLEVVDSIYVNESPSIYYDTTDMKKSVSIVSLFKIGIIGAVVGLFMACGVLFCSFLFKYCVRTKDDVDLIHLNTFARISNNNENNEYIRMAYNISMYDKINNIMIVPADSITDISKMVEVMSSEFSNIKNDIELVQVSNINTSPDVVLKAKKMDAIILVATYGKTLMTDLEYTKSEIIKANKEILGVVIDKCKH